MNTTAAPGQPGDTTRLEQDLPFVLSDLLRGMDREAGRRWGLEDFGWYVRPDLRKPMTEWEWIRELERLLPACGIGVERRRRYPAPGAGKCDLVLTSADGTRTWIEVRGAWRAWWEEQGNLPKFRFELDAGRGDIAALTCLRGADAEQAGMLLLGFGVEGDPIEAEVGAWASAALADWTCTHERWPAANDPRRVVHVWLWTRPV